MQQWLCVSLLLCAFGFFREMRPSEPFVTEYLTGEWHNIISEQLNKEIYPLGTYAVMAQLVIIFLVTDMLRYKPIILLSACAGIVLFAVLLWTTSVLEMQIGQLFYGTFMASEVAYYTYIYAKVEKNRYHIVTGHTRAAMLCGKFLGGLLAQVLVSSNTMDYQGLHYISFGSQVISLFLAVALPSVKRSLYFYTKEQKTDVPESIADIRLETVAVKSVAPPSNKAKFSWKNASRLLLQHTISAYKNPVVLQWSIWWALATCGQLQVISYVQFLWKDIDTEHVNFYNGAVEATVTLLGAGGAMAAGLMDSSRLKQWHCWILTVFPLLMGGFLIASAITSLVLVAYTMYILFGVTFYFVITIASAIVAANLCDDSFALIFGINTLVALALQTVLTVFVITDAGFGLGPRAQYLAYGGYFISIAAVYCVIVLINYILIYYKTKTLQVTELRH